MRKNTSEPWGIIPFDRDYTGLPRYIFNLLRACDKGSAITAIGHFLQTGLYRGERVALIGFDNPSYLLASLKHFGFSFETALHSEQLIYLYYKASFSHSLSLTTDYHQLFDEISHLGQSSLDRIAFINADALFNLESHLLARASAERINEATAGLDALVLGCYQATDTPVHKHLDSVGEISLSSYLELKPSKDQSSGVYRLVCRKHPLPLVKKPINLYLSTGVGFVSYTTDLIKHG